MHAVINHLHLDCPVEELVPIFDREGLPLLEAQPGFAAVYLVREAPDRAALIILWHSGEAAANGARALGPTFFAEHIAPHLASDQVRSVGEVLVSRSSS